MREVKLRVLQTTRQPNEKTNPFISMLFETLQREGVQVVAFSWLKALFGQYDLVHAHWPEYLLRNKNIAIRVAQNFLFTFWLVRLSITKKPVVMTVHNKQPHESLATVESWLLNKFLQNLSVRILMSDDGSATTDDILIPHGHYKDWYAIRQVNRKKGSILFFGLIRPYKGLERLIHCFSASKMEDAQLRILGRSIDDSLSDLIHEAALQDPRIIADLRHVPDEELSRQIQESNLVVLPYTDLYNSGALLLALSLGTPVLVPSTGTTEKLSVEVGPGWVHTYNGQLETRHINEVLELPIPVNLPDLSRRDWQPIAKRYAEIYNSLVME